MKVKVLKTWIGHQPGKILDLGKGVVTELLRRGMVEVYEEEPTPKLKPRKTFSTPKPQESC